jgi:hypothetical protein
MYSRLLVTIGAVLLSACSTTQNVSAPSNVKPVTLSNAELAIIKRDLPKSIKGAVSATYGPMQASSDGKWIYVCGLVNGVDRLGGTSGMEPYFGILEGPPGEPHVFSPIIVGHGGNKESEINNMCEKVGTSVEYLPE